MTVRTKRILLTGYPGFIGGHLIKELVRKNEDIEIYALVIRGQLTSAKQQIQKDPILRKTVIPVVGDITKSRIGLKTSKFQELIGRITDIFHLAAIYHFEVPENVAWRINVVGTYNVIQFALKCPNLHTFTHFSSMVATGRKRGIVKEDELDTAVSLHENYYEVTKHVSEHLVRKYRDRLPLIIIRPAAVIGDSQTGETNKFDGSYHIFELGKGGRNLGKFLPRFHVKDSSIRPPMVPVDYLARAVTYISDQQVCIGHTFHLGDFQVSVNEFIDTVFGKKTGEPTLLIPNKLVKLMHLPIFKYFIINKLIRIVLRKGLQIPVELLQSMDSYDLAEYQMDNSKQFLEPSGLTCPRFVDYADVIFAYQRQNRKNRQLRR